MPVRSYAANPITEADERSTTRPRVVPGLVRRGVPGSLPAPRCGGSGCRRRARALHPGKTARHGPRPGVRRRTSHARIRASWARRGRARPLGAAPARGAEQRPWAIAGSRRHAQPALCRLELWPGRQLLHFLRVLRRAGGGPEGARRGAPGAEAGGWLRAGLSERGEGAERSGTAGRAPP